MLSFAPVVIFRGWGFLLMFFRLLSSLLRFLASYVCTRFVIPVRQDLCALVLFMP